MTLLSKDIHQQFANNGVWIAPDTSLSLQSSFNSPVVIENRCQVTQSSIDCFSMIRSESLCINSSIGSYCTIGSHVQIGSYERDPQSVSLSPALHTNVFAALTRNKQHEEASKDLKINKTTDPTQSSYIPKPDTISQQKDDPKVNANKPADSDANPEDGMIFTHVVLGNDVWIGDFASIKANVNIGHGVIIRPGAFISSDIPPYTIVNRLGKVCAQRYSDEEIADLLQLEWWQYNLPEMLKQGHNIPFDNIKDFLDFFDQLDHNLLIKKPNNWQHFSS